MRIRALRTAALTAVLLLVAAEGASAQQVVGWHEATAASDLEDYLRTLQVAGKVNAYPMSARGFSIRELRRIQPADADHPWATRVRPFDPGFHLGVHRPALRAVFNSTTPGGWNDGAVWAGRGLTASITGGISILAGPLSVRVQPVAFWSQNAAFELAETGGPPSNPYGNAPYSRFIDLPQRFGDAAYSRVDPGQSSIRLDLGPVASGLSTENEIWGPGRYFPLVLSANAPGVPRFFVGTAGARDLWVGSLSARLMVGRLAQSDYSPVSPDSGRRIASGLVAVFTPRGFPNLEIGGSRFFHREWRPGGPGLEDLRVPLGNLVKGEGGVSAAAKDNEVSSVFFRASGRGAEIYGEFAKDDHTFGAPGGIVARELLTQPDHVSAFMIGFRRVWAGGADRLTSFGIEAMNARVSHIVRTHAQAEFYVHAGLPQGHTHRGQLLGSPAGFGGDALAVAYDSYTPAGRFSVRVTRVGTLTSGERRGPGPADVVYSAFLGGSRYYGRWEVDADLGAGIPVNRNARSGAGGGRVSVGVRRSLTPAAPR
jgi:hypothetical protein